MDAVELERRLTALEGWRDRNWPLLTSNVARLRRILLGDEDDKSPGGLSHDVEEIEVVIKRLDRLVTALTVANLFQLVLILVLFFMFFRYMAVP